MIRLAGILFSLAIGLQAQFVPIQRNAWTTNYTNTPVVGSNDLSVSNRNQDGSWDFHGTNANTIARLIDITNIFNTTIYGNLNCSTGDVISASSTGPNTFASYDYSLVNSNVTVITNAALKVSLAGNYFISAGAGFLAMANDFVGVQVWTNTDTTTPTPTPLVMGATIDVPPKAEIGAKTGIISLPADCYIFVVSTNSAANAQRLRNTYLTIIRLQL